MAVTETGIVQGSVQNGTLQIYVNENCTQRVEANYTHHSDCQSVQCPFTSKEQDIQTREWIIGMHCIYLH